MIVDDGCMDDKNEVDAEAVKVNTIIEFATCRDIADRHGGLFAEIDEEGNIVRTWWGELE